MRWRYGFLWLTLLLLWAPSSGLGQLQSSKVDLGKALRPQRLALIIGINRSTRSTFWPTLRYAHRDAKQMAKALHRIANFDRILTLRSPKRTTKAALIKALHRLKTWVASPEDTVLVYVSAHGTVSAERKRYIITSDATQNISQTALSVKKVQLILSQSLSRKVGLILATCYTGVASSKSVRGKGRKGQAKPLPMKQGRAIQILSAAGYAQPAFESQKLRSDVYTHFFLQCFSKLKHKTIINIHVCAAHLTTPYIKKLNGEVQVPKAYSELGANRDISLNAQAVAQKHGYFRSSWRMGTALTYGISRINQKGSPSKAKTTFSGEMTALPPGRYQVIVRDARGKVRRIQRLTIEAGGISQLASDWVFEIQSGGLLSSKGGTEQLFGGTIGFHYRHVGLKLGLWGGSQTYPSSKPSTQLYAELRGEAGHRFEWLHAELFLGGYTSLGLTMSHVGHPDHDMSLASIWNAGLTASVCFWLTNRLGIALQADAGGSLFRKSTKLTLAPEVSLHLGLHFRL